MHPDPQSYPVTLTDGAREYDVHNATDYVNAVFGSGHRRKPAPAPSPAAPAPAAPAAPTLAPVIPAATVATSSSDVKAK